MARLIRTEDNPGVAAELSGCDAGSIAISERSVSLLQDLPIFGGIDASAIELILSLSSPVHKKQGEYFFSEGEPGSSTFVLRKGSAAVTKSWEHTEYLIRHIKEGDCFGEMAVIDHLPRSASVKADADACAIEIPASALLEIYQQDPEQFTLIQMNMGREVSRRLREASDRLFEYRIGQYPAIND